MTAPLSAAATMPLVLTASGLRAEVAELIGIDAAELRDDDDLIGVGVDSISIMKLVNTLRVAGVAVKAAEFMERPTLSDWALLVDIRARESNTFTATPGVDPGAPFSLATMQHAYWVGRLPGSALAVASHFYCEFDRPDVDAARLEAAARLVAHRHPMLRARFLDDGRQQILAESPWPGLTVHDLRALCDDDATRELAAIRARESNRRLAVDAGEVFDIQLSRCPGGRSRVHVNVDMLVADALSFRIMLDELARLSEHPDAALPPIGYTFCEYLAESAVRDASRRAQAQSYWRSRLDQLPGPPELPLAVAPEELTTARVSRREHWLAVSEHHRLRERSRAHGVTVSMALATVFAEVLARWCAEPRFVLNLPLFDRRVVHPDVPLLVGDFTNLLLLEVDVSEEASFADRVRQLQARFRTDLGFADYSGVDVLRDLARERGRTLPAAPVVFTSALGMGDLFGPSVRKHLGGLTWMISQTSQVWLDHQVTEDDGRLLLNWDAVEPLFSPGVLDAMFGEYVRALGGLLAPDADWDVPMALPLPPEQAATRTAANATSLELREGLLHDAFFAQARRRPQALALAWGDGGEMSYAELAGRAEDVARRLRQRGLVAGEAVAITMPKGPGQVEAVLGVLLAGGVYVPVGVDLPASRRERIYAIAGARFVIGSEPGRLLEFPDGIEELASGAAPEPKTDRDGPALAYIIFTSGSSGEPKGVMISHRAAVNTVESLNARCQLRASDRILAVSALDFDLSVYDIFGVLSVGGAVVMVDHDARRDAEAWLHLVRRWQVTVWQSVPALLEMLLEGAAGPVDCAVRLALVGGDWPALDLCRRLTATFGRQCRLVALGGTTETTIHSTWFEVGEVPATWRSIPWGWPLDNVVCRVADSHGRDRPDWVPGELWVGGASVGQGYRNDQGRTEQQFVEHQGRCWYRTGDIARYWPDGNLEFLGRRDHQVKVRGHRVELGDVEAAFDRCPGVVGTVAVGIGERGRQQLAVAVVADGPSRLDAEQARCFVAELLPSYMVPTKIAVLDRFPLSANGKVDRRFLARALADQPVAAMAADDPPNGPVEEAIAQIWREILGAPDVTRSHSFFALGGDSLLATRFVQEARRRTGLDVALRQLFETPTVAGLAAALGATVGDDLVEEGVL